MVELPIPIKLPKTQGDLKKLLDYAHITGVAEGIIAQSEGLSDNLYQFYRDMEDWLESGEFESLLDSQYFKILLQQAIDIYLVENMVPHPPKMKIREMGKI